ncbi:hypothetical protein [Streptomyces sp. SPB162]|uniref:hypothetical protein n=1 Tax=Streptomyces sp. SPB162 TaxID=2940560 RepID=UPI0024075BB1|nr:hypothetical protein [Streptomyces sp. SPB162]MDF9811054.1 hypothetical protein [Streptomyces sp. SPB162]
MNPTDAATEGTRSADEIREYLVGRLNAALPRPEVFGGEIALRTLIDPLAFVDHREQAWADENRALRASGAFQATGVIGGFARLLPDHRDQKAAASVYAEFAHRNGWLELDRVLTPEEYRALRDAVPVWCTENKWFTDVVESFGPPSLLIGGTNPQFSKALGYATGRPEDPMVFFHLWNGTRPGNPPSGPPMYGQPVVMAVRCADGGAGPFAGTFTFTPEGAHRRPPPQEY